MAASGGLVEGWVPPEVGNLTYSEALGYVRTLADRHLIDNPETEIVDIGVHREHYSTVLWAWHYKYRKTEDDISTDRSQLEWKPKSKQRPRRTISTG